MLNGFVLAKVSLHRPACPKELETVIANKDTSAPMVVVKNREKYGTSVYVPPVVLISGAARRSVLFEQGVVSSWAFIESGVIDIKADDTISSQELMDKLNTLLVQKYAGRGRLEPLPGQAWPYILQIYPFEEYFIYAYRNVKYRQVYKLNPVSRDVALHDMPVEVKEKFVDACDNVMPRVETGMRYYSAPKGNKQTSHRGARNSELVTHVVRNWSNIQRAVDTYLKLVRFGSVKPLRPSFYPVQLSDKGSIVAQLASKGVDAFSFAHWTCQARKLV